MAWYTITKLASQGLRVLAIAYREWDRKSTLWQSPESYDADEPLRRDVESHLTRLGLAGIHDPRRETKPPISECSSAGIKVHMLTGEHSKTAKVVAKEVGIVLRNLLSLSGSLIPSIAR